MLFPSHFEPSDRAMPPKAGKCKAAEAREALVSLAVQLWLYGFSLKFLKLTLDGEIQLLSNAARVWPLALGKSILECERVAERKLRGLLRPP